MIGTTATSVLTILGLALTVQTEPRTYDNLSLKDMEELGRILRSQVAHIKLKVKKAPSDPLSAEERDGFGVVLDDNQLAVLCFLVKDADQITVKGPKGAIEGVELVQYDVNRRVAILRTKRSLSKIGLFPAQPSQAAKWKPNLPVYALTSTEGDPNILHGWLIQTGKQEELEGHPRISLKLTHGMPVFDPKAQLIGYARSVAWDLDKQMLVPWSKIQATRTSTSNTSQK